MQTLSSAGLFGLRLCEFAPQSQGGNDVFVDVGNKRVGVNALMKYLSFSPQQCLHVGDQFLNTGNDFAARGACPTIWITGPKETKYILKKLLLVLGLSTKEGDDSPAKKKARTS